jgi:hypothetical protein
LPELPAILLQENVKNPKNNWKSCIYSNMNITYKQVFIHEWNLKRLFLSS